MQRTEKVALTSLTRVIVFELSHTDNFNIINAECVGSDWHLFVKCDENSSFLEGIKLENKIRRILWSMWPRK